VAGKVGNMHPVVLGKPVREPAAHRTVHRPTMHQYQVGSASQSLDMDCH
jgi:hypothetical protein